MKIICFIQDKYIRGKEIYLRLRGKRSRDPLKFVDLKFFFFLSRIWIFNFYTISQKLKINVTSITSFFPSFKLLYNTKKHVIPAIKKKVLFQSLKDLAQTTFEFERRRGSKNQISNLFLIKKNLQAWLTRLLLYKIFIWYLKIKNSPSNKQQTLPSNARNQRGYSISFERYYKNPFY